MLTARSRLGGSRSGGARSFPFFTSWSLGRQNAALTLDSPKTIGTDRMYKGKDGSRPGTPRHARLTTQMVAAAQIAPPSNDDDDEYWATALTQKESKTVGVLCPRRCARGR
ncbi:hypothetical protein U9M48_015113 [Paspalum notatum var. saurae]|uniref:Uncharacterized protein n=1 Tax=Paspalum notatum var. saurae TaxID=547442 RepID=A0AAQ3T4K6_PASNO